MKRERLPILRDYPDPAKPLYECPECFKTWPTREDLVRHLNGFHAFPEWFAHKTADKVQARLPHEREVRDA